MASTLTHTGTAIVGGDLLLTFGASDTPGHEDRKMYVDAYSSPNPSFGQPFLEDGVTPNPLVDVRYLGYSNQNPPVKKNEVVANMGTPQDLYECKAYLYEGTASLVPVSNVILFHVAGGVVVPD